jgi:hypothetical protein
VPRALRFLDRFRRLHAPPGRPSDAIGVPASGEDVAAELAPVLSRLAEVEAQARAIEDEGRERARVLREQAERECAAILERARTEADAERGRAAAARRAAAVANAEVAHAEARREVERLRALRDAAVDELVAEVLACVWQAGR